MSNTLAVASMLADDDTDKGSPIGLFVVLLMIVAVYFLYRSLSKHIRRVPEDFNLVGPDGSALPGAAGPMSTETHAVDPAGVNPASNDSDDAPLDLTKRTGPS